jgi:hypothetical protein
MGSRALYGLAMLLGLAALAGGPAGCASRAASVPLVASAVDSAALEGEWVGDYQMPATGRSGSIQFTLRADGTGASGDVLMIPRGATQPLRRIEEPGASVAADRQTSLLTISIVRVSGDTVSGRLDPYLDPDCQCTVETTFRGRLSGDTIAGTFESQGAPGVRVGQWRVRRR